MLRISRVLAAPKNGSSRPIVAQTENGKYLVKLRGAAQGAGALVAEIIVSALARTLELPVLLPQLAVLESNTPSDDKEDELADLLTASSGVNLAFPLFETARDAKENDYTKLSPFQRATTLWLDRLVLNPDRTTKNPNMLVHKNNLYLIDHGSSLRFQYDWRSVTEATPRKVGVSVGRHVFEGAAESSHWSNWDSTFADCITREVLINAVALVPECFLVPLLPIDNSASISVQEAIIRRQAAYVAFLWKRLKTPRLFASEEPESQPKSIFLKDKAV